MIHWLLMLESQKKMRKKLNRAKINIQFDVFHVGHPSSVSLIPGTKNRVIRLEHFFENKKFGRQTTSRYSQTQTLTNKRSWIEKVVWDKICNLVSFETQKVYSQKI